MEARQWTGDDDRDLSEPPRCQQCGCALYDEEIDAGLEDCRRCLPDVLAAESDRSAA
jgi:hypothetical protein